MAKREALLTKKQMIEQLRMVLLKMHNECTAREVEGERDRKLEELTKELDTVIDAGTE